MCDKRGIPATVVNPKCGCLNCNGSGMAYTIASLWAMARSPLLLGGALPQDAGTMRILSNPHFSMVHSMARNQSVIEFTQANTSTPNQRGWVKWVADLDGGGEYKQVVLVINVGNAEAATNTSWTALGLTTGRYTAMDLW